MSDKFCGVCRHPFPGHHPTCPIVTQEPQMGNPDSVQMSSMMQNMPWLKEWNMMALEQVEYDEAVAFLCERLNLTTSYLVQATEGHTDFKDFCLQNLDAIEKVAKLGYERQLEVLRKLGPV